jgi:hypothetical protein
MKFPKLPLGQRFLYQDETYVKVGPLTARRERDGEQRLLPRSALVSIPGEPAQAPSPGLGQAGLGPLGPALDAYELALRAALLPPGADPGPGDSARLDSALAAARAAFRAALGERGPER